MNYHDEVIETNNWGDYLSFDLVNGNRRKYHGLYAWADEYLEHWLVWAGLNLWLKLPERQEQILLGAGNYPDQASRWPQVLQGAYRQPYPQQKLRWHGVDVNLAYQLDSNQRGLSLTIDIATPETLILKAEPLVTWRKVHGLGLTETLPFSHHSHGVQWQAGGQRFHLQSPTANWEAEEHNSQNHYYASEAERGYPDREDLALPGHWELYCARPGHYQLTIQLQVQTQQVNNKFAHLWQKLREPDIEPLAAASVATRMHLVLPKAPADFAEYLAVGSAKLLVETPQRTAIMAGLPWFGEWGRDTFISLPGVFLPLGRHHSAKRLLLEWAEFLALGLLPNTTADLSLHSLDATLWYGQALWRYWEETGDRSTVAAILPRYARALAGLSHFDKFGIHVDNYGCLNWTDASAALTWMDAKVDGTPVTDRHGSAVEIQALWYNALRITLELSKHTRSSLPETLLLNNTAVLLDQHFAGRFWQADKGYYADSISPAGTVRAELRPNQLLLYSLAFQLGRAEHFASVINHCRLELLTPVGLRTLSPRAEGYRADYQGDQRQRDLSYHQGIVWPWLLGHYCLALLQAPGDQAEQRAEVESLLGQFWQELLVRGLGTIPELFAGSKLEPAGAPLQAWSYATISEVYLVLSKS